MAAAAIAVLARMAMPAHGQTVEHSLTHLPGLDVFYGATANQAGGFVAVGWQDTAPDRTIGRVHSETGDGRLLFDIALEQPDATAVNLFNVIRLADGDYVAAGFVRWRERREDCFAVRFRADGGVVWQTAIPGREVERCYFAVAAPDGDVIVGGRHEMPDAPGAPTHGLVWRLDRGSGEVRASSRREFAAAQTVRSAFRGGALLADGSLLLGGWATDPQRGGDDVWLLTLAPNGRAKPERRWGSVGNNLAETVLPVADGAAFFGFAAQSRDATDDAPPRGRLACGSDSAATPLTCRGLVGTIAGDGSAQVYVIAAGGTGPDLFHGAAAMPDGHLLAVGTAATGSGPGRGWFAEIDPRNGAVRSSLVFSDGPAGELHAVAPLSAQRVALVGHGRTPDRPDIDGWVARLTVATATARVPGPPSAAGITNQAAPTGSPPAIPAPSESTQPAANLGIIDASRPQLLADGRIAARQILRYTFTVASEMTAEIVLFPRGGDVDLALRAGDAGPAAISNNSGTAVELIERRLGPGSYNVEIVGNAAASFRLLVRWAARAPPSGAAQDLEEKWGENGRRAVKHALKLLGYSPDELNCEPRFSSTTRMAIRAFQASLGTPTTGWLEDAERLRLSVAASQAAEQLAKQYATRAEASAASPIAVSLPGRGTEPLRSGREPVPGDAGPELLLGVGERPLPDGSDATTEPYKGEWRAIGDPSGDTVYVPSGFGVSTGADAVSAGEFKGGAMKGYGIVRGPGALIRAGEWNWVSQAAATGACPALEQDFDNAKTSAMIGYGVQIDGSSRTAGVWGIGSDGEAQLVRAIPF
ncbi:MAG: peptidoglycan-binding protein [Alphaproteobacteria bacterium]|nr:peptidoglycan-binding protein [Alphaproteobacteria bacterium]